MKPVTFLLLVVAAGANAGTINPPLADQSGIGMGLMRYLARHGQLCVGKYDWPITVSALDAANGQRDALQLPALAQAGLVDAAPAAEGAVRYALSEAGRAYYWPRQVARRDGTPGQKEVHDFCAGQLRLDRVVQWSAPVRVGDHYETTARYTYAIGAAPWTGDPRLQQVFPMITRVIAGQHTAQLAQRLQYIGGRWEALVAID
jgi:hypothetical protein